MRHVIHGWCMGIQGVGHRDIVIGTWGHREWDMGT